MYFSFIKSSVKEIRSNKKDNFCLVLEKQIMLIEHTFTPFLEQAIFCPTQNI